MHDYSPARTIVLALALIAMSGCATKIGGDPKLQVLDASELPLPGRADMAPPERPYVVGAFDRLTIDVFGIEELANREIQVTGEGMISFPLAGDVQVAGMTPNEIRDILAVRLRANHIRNPAVSVAVKEIVSQVVTVEGEVKKPGLYPIQGRMGLLRAMALAEGVTEFARMRDVVVFRTVGGQKYAALYNLDAIRRGAYGDPDIYPNDTIVVGDSKTRRLLKDILTLAPLLTTPIILLD